jgi:hypothetical protein
MVRPGMRRFLPLLVLLLIACAGCIGWPEPRVATRAEDETQVTARTPAGIGSVQWLRETGGRLGALEALHLRMQPARTMADGVTRMLEAKLAILPPSDVDFDRWAPPDTPMIRASEAYLRAHASAEMREHCYRTAYFTLLVMSRTRRMLDAHDIETTWAAALLHDIGLEHPRHDGSDFSLVGIDALEALAAEHGFERAKTIIAAEAIAQNTSPWVDREAAGLVPWAMQAGGSAEVFHSPYTALISKRSLAELESRHPRGAMLRVGTSLIRAEARAVPNGRFALLEGMGFLQLAR